MCGWWVVVSAPGLGGSPHSVPGPGHKQPEQDPDRDMRSSPHQLDTDTSVALSAADVARPSIASRL